MSLSSTTPLANARLIEMIEAAHGRTLALGDGLESVDLADPPPGPHNPPAWEIGHVAWFQETQMLRREADAAFDPSKMEPKK